MDIVYALQTLQAILDRGKKLHFPDGILINGRGPNGVSFTVEQGDASLTLICNQFSLCVCMVLLLPYLIILSLSHLCT